MNLSPKLAVFGIVTALATGCATAADPDAWIVDFEKARETARAEGKKILVNFTGSDWCGACMMIERSVLSKNSFIEAASKNFVLLEIDLPDRKPQSDELRAQNKYLASFFSINVFPTFLILDEDGRAKARSIGPPGRTVESFLGWLERNG